MTQNEDKRQIDGQQREALISLIALYFIEENQLLSAEQLGDAKNSLKALFLRTSGEESMLRKLIEILKTTRGLQLSFSNISKILVGMSKCVITVDRKIDTLRTILDQNKASAEETEAFVGPFMSFSQEFLQHTESYARNMEQYLEVKESEARYFSTYQIAKNARERLRQRLSSSTLATESDSTTESPSETKLKQQIISSFDYGETERNYKQAVRESRALQLEITEQLADIKAMCQMAMNPNMRQKGDKEEKPKQQYDDVFMRFREALGKFPRLGEIKAAVLDLFRLYQHSYGIFSLDFDNLNKAIATMIENATAYFEAKDEDSDIKTKRDKLHKIEGLIPFLERAAETMNDEEIDTYNKFSRRISDMITHTKNPWMHIYEELLRSKVQAEAELSTRL